MADQKRLLADLLTQAQNGSASSFGKLLTAAENVSVRDVYGLPGFLNPPSLALRLGVTGPPGAGKSTLVSGLITGLREKNLKVGVLAVDPSSPFTGGAILGDRIRYQNHFLDEGVFIRSLGTRGSLGGLSASAHRLLRLFDLCCFDVVLVETVGVGQTELDVLHVADRVMVVLVPESGDSIQAMKAGLMEVADIFVVNKADRPGAAAMAKDIESSFFAELDGGAKPPKVVLTSATENQGISVLVDDILNERAAKSFIANRNRPERLRHEAQMILRREMDEEIRRRTSAIAKPEDLLKSF